MTGSCCLAWGCCDVEHHPKVISNLNITKSFSNNSFLRWEIILKLCRLHYIDKKRFDNWSGYYRLEFRMSFWINIDVIFDIRPSIYIYIYIVKGLRPVRGGGGGCCHNARGRVRNRNSNPEGFSPSALWQQPPVLIKIIALHFRFHPVNASDLLVKGAYVLEARAFSRAPPIVMSRGAP